MGKRAIVVVPLLIAVLLSGCAAPVPDQFANPLEDLEKVIDLVPWAKSVAADASAEELTAGIEEITAGLPTLDIPAETRSDAEARLKGLTAAVLADPANTAAHIAELNAIIYEIRGAL